MNYAEELAKKIRCECTKQRRTLDIILGTDTGMRDTIIVGKPNDDDRCLLIHFQGGPTERRYYLKHLPTRSVFIPEVGLGDLGSIGYLKVPAEREVHDYTHDQMLAGVLGFLGQQA